MRYFGVKKRLAKKRIGSKGMLKKMLMGARLKPGDVINTCSGFNVVVAKVEIDFMHVSNHLKTPVPADFTITDTDGMQHSWTGCCGPAETPEQICAYIANFEEDTGQKRSEFGPEFAKIFDDVVAGKNPLDSRGCLLPEYK